jgi:hypothetical protein
VLKFLLPIPEELKPFGRLSMGKRWAQIYDGVDGSMEELA